MNSQQEHSNLSCGETERPEQTNNAIPSPFGRAPLNSRVRALKPGKSSSDTCLRPVTLVSAQATTSNLVAAMASSSLLPCRPFMLVMLLNITLQLVTDRDSGPGNFQEQTGINPFNPSVPIWHRLAKLSILILEGIIKKISYERRDYESVDEKSLS